MWISYQESPRSYVASKNIGWAHHSAFEVDTGNESAEPHKAHFERENIGTFEVVGEWILPEYSGSCVLQDRDETDQRLFVYLMQVLAASRSSQLEQVP